MDLNANISGMGEAKRLLDGLPDRVANKVVKAGLDDAAKIGVAAVKDEAKSHASGKKDHKRLYATAIVRAKSYQSGEVQYRAVGFAHPEGAHGWLVEHGHRMVVGGSVARLRGRSRVAAIEAKSKTYTYSQYLGTNSRYRRLRKQGVGYMKAGGERGHGQVVGFVPPHPIVSPAFASVVSSMQSAFVDRVTTDAERELLDLAAGAK